MPRVALLLLAPALLMGCGSSESDRSEDSARVVAPMQEAALVAAVRARAGEAPSYNPPRFDLVTLRDDGSGMEVLAAVPGEELRRISAPNWSPDAQLVYFIGGTKEVQGRRSIYEESDVFAIEVAQRKLRRLTSTHDVQAVVASPDGKQLAIARMEDPGSFPVTVGLWLVGSDGGEPSRMLEGKAGQIDFPGGWSPDGRKLAFARCTFTLPHDDGLIPNTCGVYTVSTDGSNLRELADRSSSPTFSPDGRLIAFVSDRDENGTVQAGSDEDQFAGELYVMDADGNDQRRLTESEGLDEQSPAWSPDGSRIAFARRGPAAFADQLMIVNPDGTCSKVLVGDASKGGVDSSSFRSPAWRPGRLKHGTSRGGCGKS